MSVPRQAALRSGAARNLSNPVCSRCLLRLSRLNAPRSRHAYTLRSFAAPRLPKQQVPHRAYFAANGIRDRLGHNVYGPLWTQFFTSQSLRASAQTTPADPVQQLWSSPPTSDQPQETPITTRARRRRKELENEADPSSQSASIPPDASSQLSTLATRHPPSSTKRLLTSLLSLSKPRLTFLMVLTTAASYSLFPTPTLLSSIATSTPAPSLSALTLLYLTLGTSLCSASANALNMLLEPAHDAKMSRTRNRPLVRGLITKGAALAFAAVAAGAGITGLYWGVNPTVAFLGGANIVLYAGVYTPLKRLSVLNTWVGAIVGGIPPLMGWAAASGQAATGAGDWRELLLGEGNVGGWLLAALLFAWQFPHFNALSWSIRDEYRAAGYRMLAWVNPARNGRVAVRYALLMLPVCWGLSWVGVTDRGFVVSSSVVNAWVVREAVRFWRLEGRRGSARGLFWAGVWQLPILLVLGMGHKRGLWEGVWRWARGGAQEEDAEEEGEFFYEEEGSGSVPEKVGMKVVA